MPCCKTLYHCYSLYIIKNELKTWMIKHVSGGFVCSVGAFILDIQIKKHFSAGAPIHVHTYMCSFSLLFRYMLRTPWMFQIIHQLEITSANFSHQLYDVCVYFVICRCMKGKTICWGNEKNALLRWDIFRVGNRDVVLSKKKIMR